MEETLCARDAVKGKQLYEFDLSMSASRFPYLPLLQGYILIYFRICFAQYITTKAVKRMETYRIRGSTKVTKKLLFPLSFGASSAALLYILDHHLQGQLDRMNRVAYQLHVIHVDLYMDAPDRKESTILLGKFQALFPRHTYSTVGLEEALKLDRIDWNSIGMERPYSKDSQMSGAEQLRELFGSMPSATSRADIISILLTRLLVDIAKKSNCESILFGDSTTRLAEKSLAETAKGRGFSLPWQISDGSSPYGIGFNYPMRDLLKKEVGAFTSLTTPPLTDMIVHQEPLSRISASSKLTTIDDLMAQYFESVEENYPSIVANVVRTSSKLKALNGDMTTSCGLCGLPVAEGTGGIFGWGGDQSTEIQLGTEHQHSGILCYGCSRSING